MRSELPAMLAPVRRALTVVAAVLACGRLKYPDNSGFRQPAGFHFNRARAHLEALAAGDQSEDHLVHATARLLMALQARELGVSPEQLRFDETHQQIEDLNNGK
jgi:hypothetical protein